MNTASLLGLNCRLDNIVAEWLFSNLFGNKKRHGVSRQYVLVSAARGAASLAIPRESNMEFPETGNSGKMIGFIEFQASHPCPPISPASQKKFRIAAPSPSFPTPTRAKPR
ncbi:hypothetical protein [Chromobacterium violaceum]|uniref:hypothetical protein n=1 Tax=Chromobacterium violaceum TaxID=536 RepID=UPI001C8B2926|nr:hypothetical protein [Chromobacterium violaceum]MBX9267279.1 hypothetical protein [Chromobacterium violaceum]